MHTDGSHTLLTVDETADLARVTRGTIYRWARAGVIPAVRIGGSLRIPRAEFEHRLREPDDHHEHEVTMLSLPALARAAEHHIRRHGPTTADDLVLALDADHEHAQAGIRLALITGRLMLDRDATLRLVSDSAAA
jgi:excisionase family DNA binding protein